MEVLQDVLSDEATSFSNHSSSLNGKKLQGVCSADTTELLAYQGAGGGPMSPLHHGSSDRTNSTRLGHNNNNNKYNSNNANHLRSYCNSAKLTASMNTDEEDLLDEFFNTVQEYVCKQKEMEERIQRHPLTPSKCLLYQQQDVIDFVFENVENITCNQSKDLANDADLQETLEKLETLGHSVQLKLYRKNPEEAQKNVDEWFLDSIACAQQSQQQPTTDIATTTSSDFKDRFMQRMQQMVCAQRMPNTAGDQSLIAEQRDEKDALGHVFETVESALCESADLTDVYPLERTATPSRRSDGSSGRNNGSRQSDKSPVVPATSPAANSTFVATLDGEESVASESGSTYASSVGTYSYTEHSQQTYSVLSPRSEASTNFSPRSAASTSAHSRSGHDNSVLSNSSSQSDDEEDYDDETTAFDTVSRPLFVIKEEVSATESMASDRAKNEKKKRQQDVINAKNGKKTYPFRYSSTHYRCSKQKCAPDAAADAAQGWLEHFKYAVEVTVFKLSSVLDTMSFDTVCNSPDTGRVEDEKDIMEALEEASAHKSTIEKLQDSITTDVANMCGDKAVLDDPDEEIKAKDLLINKVVNRSKFASVSIMPSADEEDDETTAFGDYNEEEEEEAQPFDVAGYNTVPDYHTATYYRSLRRPQTVRQQEPPEDIRKKVEGSVRADRTSTGPVRGRDPEPSHQLRLHKDSLVVSAKHMKEQQQLIRSPRSSETEKTAEMTAATSAASGTLPDDDEDTRSGSPSNLALKPSNGRMDMVVCLPRRAGTATTVHQNVVDQTPRQRNAISASLADKALIRDSSTHSSRTPKEVSHHSATFHTARILSVFDDDTYCYDDGDEDNSKLSCGSETQFSNLSDTDLRTTCTDIVIYEPKPDFAKLAIASPWQLVVYVAWLSVSFLVRVNGEMNSQLAERKDALQALLERKDSNSDLMTAFSRDSLEAVPSIDFQLSLQ